MEEKNKADIEVHIDLNGLKASVKTSVPIDETGAVIKQFLSDLKESCSLIRDISAELPSLALHKVQNVAQNKSSEPVENHESHDPSTDNPLGNIANDLGVTLDKIREAKLFAFKPGVNKPQLTGYTKLNPENGALAILYAYEIGLGKSFVPYEEANEVFQLCPYKVGTLSNRVAHNLKKANKIDSKRYDGPKELTLTPAGLESIRKQIKEILGNGQ